MAYDEPELPVFDAQQVEDLRASSWDQICGFALVEGDPRDPQTLRGALYRQLGGEPTLRDFLAIPESDYDWYVIRGLEIDVPAPGQGATAPLSAGPRCRARAAAAGFPGGRGFLPVPAGSGQYAYASLGRTAPGLPTPAGLAMGLPGHANSRCGPRPPPS